MRRTAGLGGRAGRFVGREERGGKDRRGKGKEVEGDEKEFVKGADRE